MNLLMPDNFVPISKVALARIANVTPYTLRTNIKILLNFLLENGYTLKKGVEIIR
jgi:hypothetical protein